PLTRRLILQKARHHSHLDAALTDCRHMVSGTLSLPSRGTFHHSLTVLIRYRSPGSIQLYQVVLADSHEIPRVPCYSCTHTLQSCPCFAYGTLTHSGPVSHQVRLHKHHHRPVMLNQTMHAPQHPHSNTSTLDTDEGLGSSGFARHYYRNHSYFLFLRVLRCFTSPRSPHAPYTFSHGILPSIVAVFTT